MDSLKHLPIKIVVNLQERKILFDLIKNGILITDEDTNIIYANPAFSVITGYTKQEVLGKKSDILYSGFHEDFFYEKMWGEINNNGS